MRQHFEKKNLSFLCVVKMPSILSSVNKMRFNVFTIGTAVKLKRKSGGLTSKFPDTLVIEAGNTGKERLTFNVI